MTRNKEKEILYKKERITDFISTQRMMWLVAERTGKRLLNIWATKKKHSATRKVVR